MRLDSSHRFPWILTGTLLVVCVAMAWSEAPREVRAELAARPEPQARATADTASAGRVLLEQFSAAFQEASERVNPSVVPLLSERKVSTGPFPMRGDDRSGEEMFRRFFGDPRRMPRGEQTLQNLGSGVIVSEDGYILTNNHVVQNADKLTVVTSDDRKHEAKVVGRDPDTDLAVVKIEATGLTPATLGDSDALHVGQWVIAVGNPLQMMHTVTAGIVSATGRSSVGVANYEDFIQTDASINPGNSGGALADLDGRVVGINTALASPTGGNVGIGFAIPINMARRIMEDLIDSGRISRGYLGVEIQPLDHDLARGLGLDVTKGALVSAVSPSSAAERAGVERGDVIVGFNGAEVDGVAQLRNLVAAAKPDSKNRLRILRDGRAKELDVTLDERPGQAAAVPAEQEQQSSGPRLGLSIQDLTPEIARELGLDPGERGVLISDVEVGGPAEAAGVRRGDVVLSVGRQPVRSVEELRGALAELHSGDTAVLLIRRGQRTLYVAVKTS